MTWIKVKPSEQCFSTVPWHTILKHWINNAFVGCYLRDRDSVNLASWSHRDIRDNFEDMMVGKSSNKQIQNSQLYIFWFHMTFHFNPD